MDDGCLMHAKYTQALPKNVFLSRYLKGHVVFSSAVPKIFLDSYACLLSCFVAGLGRGYEILYKKVSFVKKIMYQFIIS